NGDGGPANAARFVGPAGVTTDPQRNLYIVDSKAAVVRVVNNQDGPITVAGIQIDPGAIATVAGNGTVCQPGTGGYADCGEDGPATSASLDIRVGIPVDAAGDSYVWKA